MALGFTIERIAYRPLRRAPRLAPLITAIGVSILLQNVAMLIWGRSYHSVPAVASARAASIRRRDITDVQICHRRVAALMMAGLLLLVHRTRLGRAMRATAENPQVAGLMGVNINTHHLGHLRDRLRARGGRRRDGGRQLRHRALLHGLHARPQGLHGGGAGRHRQSRRARCWAGCCSG